MSERVVDLLEAVEIHHQHGARLAGPVRGRDRLVHAVTEQGAVRQPGESVVERLVLERLGVGLALGDVADAVRS